MKLYFAPGACSLAPHIVLHEAGVPFEAEKVDNKAKTTKSGENYLDVNPRGMVPALKLDNGEILTEGPAIVQYIADMKPDSGLMPKPGSFERYRVLEWLNYITSEVHKQFTPLFKPNTPDDYKPIAKENLNKAFKHIDAHLAGKKFLTGDPFTVADAYLFVVTNWSRFQDIDVAQWPNLKAFQERVKARQAVQEAMKTEGLIKAAA